MILFIFYTYAIVTKIRQSVHFCFGEFWIPQGNAPMRRLLLTPAKPNVIFSYFTIVRVHHGGGGHV